MLKKGFSTVLYICICKLNLNGLRVIYFSIKNVTQTLSDFILMNNLKSCKIVITLQKIRTDT